MESDQLGELLLQSLEHERGKVDLYQTALRCAHDDALKAEWVGYLEQTRKHERILTEVCRTLSIDPEQMASEREAVKYLGNALVSAMELAHESGTPSEAQRFACTCVALAETQGHSNWQLIGTCARNSHGERRQVLLRAATEIEGEEEEPVSHARQWARQLWLHALGAEAVPPVPGEREVALAGVGVASAAPPRAP